MVHLRTKRLAIKLVGRNTVSAVLLLALWFFSIMLTVTTGSS